MKERQASPEYVFQVSAEAHNKKLGKGFVLLMVGWETGGYSFHHTLK